MGNTKSIINYSNNNHQNNKTNLLSTATQTSLTTIRPGFIDDLNTNNNNNNKSRFNRKSTSTMDKQAAEESNKENKTFIKIIDNTKANKCKFKKKLNENHKKSKNIKLIPDINNNKCKSNENDNSSKSKLNSCTESEYTSISDYTSERNQNIKKSSEYVEESFYESTFDIDKFQNNPKTTNKSDNYLDLDEANKIILNNSNSNEQDMLKNDNVIVTVEDNNCLYSQVDTQKCNLIKSLSQNSAGSSNASSTSINNHHHHHHNKILNLQPIAKIFQKFSKNSTGSFSSSSSTNSSIKCANNHMKPPELPNKCFDPNELFEKMNENSNLNLPPLPPLPLSPKKSSNQLSLKQENDEIDTDDNLSIMTTNANSSSLQNDYYQSLPSEYNNLNDSTFRQIDNNYNQQQQQQQPPPPPTSKQPSKSQLNYSIDAQIYTSIESTCSPLVNSKSESSSTLEQLNNLEMKLNILKEKSNIQSNEFINIINTSPNSDEQNGRFINKIDVKHENGNNLENNSILAVKHRKNVETNMRTLSLKDNDNNKQIDYRQTFYIRNSNRNNNPNNDYDSKLISNNNNHQHVINF